MADFNELLNLAYQNIEALNKKIQEFDAIHQDIISLKNAAFQENEGLKTAIMADANKIKNEVVGQVEALRKEAIEAQKGATSIPTAFQQKFEQIKALSEQYLKGLDITTHKYLEGNNKLFDNNQLDFSRKVEKIGQKANAIQEEIDRLRKIDLVADFERLRKDFLTKATTELSKELNKVDGKVAQFDPPLKRLEAVDLDTHFDKLQKTLSDIFGAINAINLTFTQITQTLVSIQKSVNDGFSDTKKSLSNQDTQLESLLKKTDEQEVKISDGFISVKETVSKHLSKQDTRLELLLKKIDEQEVRLTELSKNNKQLIDKIKNISLIQIVGFVIIIITMVILKFLTQS